MSNFVNSNTPGCLPSICDRFDVTSETLSRNHMVASCEEGRAVFRIYEPVEISIGENGELQFTTGSGNTFELPPPGEAVTITQNPDGTITIGNADGSSSTTFNPNNPGGLTITSDGSILTIGDGTNTFQIPLANSISVVDNGNGTSTVTIGSESFLILNGIGPNTPIFMLPNGAGQIEVTLADGTQFIFDASVSTGAGAPLLSGTFPLLTQGVAMTPFIPTNSGGPATSWAITSGSLPDGLLFSASTGQFTGTPTNIGTTNIEVTATNGSGSSVLPLAIVVGAALAAPDLSTSASMPDGTSGVFYGPYSATNTGGAVDTWSATGLPSGVTINPTTGTISGTPTVTGSFNIVITATNATGSDTLPDTISIAVPVAAPLLSGAAPDGSVGNLYAGFIPTNTGGAVTTWSISPALPAGLNFNTSTGEITGTPTVEASYSGTITATNSGGSDNLAITFEVITVQWESAQITSVIDAGNLDDQTSSSGNDASAILYIGDLTSFGTSISTTDTAAVANGGAIDDVTTTGSPVVFGNSHGVNFGDQIITQPSNQSSITEMRMVLTSGDVPDDFLYDGAPYTSGTWVPAVAGKTIMIQYAVPELGSGSLTVKDGNVTYEFKYPDGTVLSASALVRARNSDGTPPP